MIKTAVPDDSAHCMIADGLKAELPHARAVAVDLATIRYTDKRNGRRYIYLTPPEAQSALLEFDEGFEPEPFDVAAHAVQIIEPKARRKEDASSPLDSEADSTSSPSLVEAPETSSVFPSEDPSQGRKSPRAMLIANPAGGGTTPIKLGGTPLPTGALARGKGTAITKNKSNRIGRTRKFGLRAMATRRGRYAASSESELQQ
jgi:hypothetical protein